MATTRDNLQEFFDFIWGDETGWVYSPIVNKENHWKQLVFEWPIHKADLVSHCLKYSANGYEVYFSPSLYKEPAKATKDNVKGTRVLWVDFDGNGHERPRPDTLPAESDAATATPEPSMVVRTSLPGHLHAYWALDEFLTDTQEIEKYNRVLAYSQNADTSGWDATQLLRPPYTLNHGYAKPERKGKAYDVVIEEQTSQEYGKARFPDTRQP